MKSTCHCGMTVEHPKARSGGQECGTSICRSCGIQVESTTYCRWCPTSLGASRAA
jgi:hypothetical protein